MDEPAVPEIDAHVVHLRRFDFGPAEPKKSTSAGWSFASGIRFAAAPRRSSSTSCVL
jgi:hypothetical protein